MLINNKNIGYAEKANVLGAIVGVNLLDNTVTLMDDNEKVHTFSLEDVAELQEIGAIDSEYIYEGDVVKVTDTDKVYEVVVLHDEEDTESGEKHVAMHLLDKKFNRIEGGQGMSFDRKQIKSFSGVLELLGNVQQLKADVKTVDFNLAVFRRFANGEVTYFYAGNDKVKETVDLIKVLFVGHHILEEEEYERTTFSYEQFLEMVESGLLKEVSPMEVANYVAGKIHGATPVQESVSVFDASGFDDNDVDTDEDEDEEELCEECEYPVEECECELW